MVGTLSKDLWREATDITSPDWPPRWLKVSGILWFFWLVALIAWLMIAVIVPTFISILVAMGLGISDLMSRAKWAQFLLKPVHGYLNIHSVDFPFSSGQLFSFWMIVGVLSLLWSLAGSIGGRIGWATFGIVTAGMVWSETPELSKWIGTGLAAALWSLSTIVAYRKANKNTSDGGPSGRTSTSRIGRFPEFFATIERRAEGKARLHDYFDLADYLDNNVNRSRDIIATDLGIPRDRVLELLRRRFPHGVPGVSSTSPRCRQEIVKAAKEGQNRAAIADRYGISQSTVSKVIKDHKNEEKPTK
jgi:hypothetical protein